MLSEHAIVFNSNDVVCVLRVVLFKMQQDLELYSGLVLELLLVADDLDGYDLASLVVHTLQGLPEGALAKEVNHFKSVSDLVLQDHVVVSSLVIVAVVVREVAGAFDLLGAKTEEVAHLVVEDFTLLEFS